MIFVDTGILLQSTRLCLAIPQWEIRYPVDADWSWWAALC